MFACNELCPNFTVDRIVYSLLRKFTNLISTALACVYIIYILVPRLVGVCMGIRLVYSSKITEPLIQDKIKGLSILLIVVILCHWYHALSGGMRQCVWALSAATLDILAWRDMHIGSGWRVFPACMLYSRCHGFNLGTLVQCMWTALSLGLYSGSVLDNIMKELVDSL